MEHAVGALHGRRNGKGSFAASGNASATMRFTPKGEDQECGSAISRYARNPARITKRLMNTLRRE